MISNEKYGEELAKLSDEQFKKGKHLLSLLIMQAAVKINPESQIYIERYAYLNDFMYQQIDLKDKSVMEQMKNRDQILLETKTTIDKLNATLCKD